jgi:transposase-like protein
MNLQYSLVGSLTTAQFDAAVAAFPRLSDKGKAAARLVLVDGALVPSVSKEYDIARSQVYKWVKDIYQAHIDCPEGWQTKVVVLPPDLMLKVMLMERKARSKLKGKKLF